MTEPYAAPGSLDWKQARRSAFVQEVLSVFTQRPTGLMSFDHVQQKLQLDNVRYLELQDVRVDLIAGSVGRYSDFTRAFFPRKDHLQQRWQRIDELVASGHALPPIELYKVGQVYFVRDGNHRVSVARQRGLTTLRAKVWEYETDVPLGPDHDVDDLLCRTAHAAFVERTQIDTLCPDVQIRLTQPDGYEHLLGEIEAYQRILSGIDGREIPFDEAVTLWCEIRYVPIIEIIRHRYVLEEFPGRTETDLYLWLLRNQADLESRYERDVLMAEAADDLTARLSESPLPVGRLRKAVDSLRATAVQWTTEAWTVLRRALGRRTGTR
jgi:hypothetical protein